MVGVDTSAGGEFVVVWETNLSIESRSESANVGEIPFPQHPDGCNASARARLHVLALTEEVAVLTTARHAVASLGSLLSVAARIGGPGAGKGDRTDLCDNMVYTVNYKLYSMI